MRKETGNSWFRCWKRARRSNVREGVVAPDYPHPVAADWPGLLRIIEDAFAERMKDNRANHRRLWWQFGTRPGFEAMRSGA